MQDHPLVAAFKERPRVEWRKLMVACARRFTPCTCIAVRLLRGPLV
jgi:N-acetyl-beta-hexosaminidase